MTPSQPQLEKQKASQGDDDDDAGDDHDHDDEDGLACYVDGGDQNRFWLWVQLQTWWSADVAIKVPCRRVVEGYDERTDNRTDGW